MREIANIAFDVNTFPEPKLRPRFARRGRKVITYTPKKTKAFEEDVRGAFAGMKDYVPCENEDVAVKIKLLFFMQVPKSMPKYKRIQVTDGAYRPLHKPDIDNLIKAVMDSLNGLAYHDDRQVASIIADKFYTTERPKITVILHYYENGEPRNSSN